MRNKKYLGFIPLLKAHVYELADGRKMYKFSNGKTKIYN